MLIIPGKIEDRINGITINHSSANECAFRAKASLWADSEWRTVQMVRPCSAYCLRMRMEGQFSVWRNTQITHRSREGGIWREKLQGCIILKYQMIVHYQMIVLFIIINTNQFPALDSSSIFVMSTVAYGYTKRFKKYLILLRENSVMILRVSLLFIGSIL